MSSVRHFRLASGGLAISLILATMSGCNGGWGGPTSQRPLITSQPSSQTVVLGQAAAFTISATGSAPLSYQWSQGGVAISGATSTSYTTPATTGIGTSIYTVSVTNTAGTALSTGATLTVVAPMAPTLSFVAIPAKTYGDAPFAVSAASVSAGAVTYSVVSGPATIAASTVTLTGTGTVVLGAAQAASGPYTAATTTTTFTVLPITITAISPAAQTIAPGLQTFTAAASAGNLTWSASGGTIAASGVWTSPNTPGTYTITATSVTEPSVSVSTTIIVSLPVITTQPVSKNVCTGANPSLSVAASYATSYQWHFGGSAVGDAPTLTLNNVTSANNGSYSCTVSNGAGSVTSNAVTLNLVNPTTLNITRQPSSVSVYATQTATFSVSASGTGTLTYQWYKGAVGSGIAISGAVASTYTTAALTSADSGTGFYVTVTDADCAGTPIASTAAVLTVSIADTAVPPTIVVQPIGQTAGVGASTTYSVTATGSGTLTYQWYRVAYSSTELTQPTAGVAVSGATSSTYTAPASETAQSNDGDNYYVVVTNNYGSAVSNRAFLAVGAGIALQITKEPNSDYVPPLTLAGFNVNATCTGCIPAYQWYWYAPGSSSATALSNGAVSSGTLNGATVAGTTTSSLTLTNVPATASNAIFYVVITSTSDGASQISGTNPLTSSTAGLFVGSLATVGNPSGNGLCNNSTTWVLNGNQPGTSLNDIPYQNLSNCTMELTNNSLVEHATVFWPAPISTAKLSISFSVALSTNGNETAADGFTMILADPSQGATTASLGLTGYGLGADGIPGFVLGFDTYQNGDAQTHPGPGCVYLNDGSTPVACDPVPVPYMAVGQGATALWENPWSFVNGALNTQSSTNYSPAAFANATHAYVITLVHNSMTVTIDGNELFTGTVTLPPVAYLGFTASTGAFEESVTISNLTANISEP